MIRLVNPPPYLNLAYDCAKRPRFEVEQCDTTILRFKTTAAVTPVTITIYGYQNYIYRQTVITDVNGNADFDLTIYDLADFNSYRNAFRAVITNGLFETDAGYTDELFIKFLSE